jgi:hypothetical protein
MASSNKQSLEYPRPRFEYVASLEQRKDKAAAWLRRMVEAEFELGPEKMHEIFDDPGSNYQILTYNRSRGEHVPPKITVLAVAAFSREAGFVPYVADRSGRKTSHLIDFFEHLEGDTFSNDERKTLTVGEARIPKTFLEGRGYQVVTPSGHQLTAEVYRRTAQTDSPAG